MQYGIPDLETERGYFILYNIKNFIVCLFLMVVLCGCGHDVSFLSTESVAEEGQDNAEYETVDTAETTTTRTTWTEEESKPELVAVYVCGAVNNPGVYYVEATAIKETAIEMAGGFCEGADKSYVNLAQFISQGERIYIPTKEETESVSFLEEESQGNTDAALQMDGQKININTAGKEELMTLPGIGENKAEAIIEYRQSQGKFCDTDEIMNIDGIKEGVYNKIKDLIIVG